MEVSLVDVFESFPGRQQTADWLKQEIPTLTISSVVVKANGVSRFAQHCSEERTNQGFQLHANQ